MSASLSSLLLLFTLCNLPSLITAVTTVDVDKLWNDDFVFKEYTDPFSISGWLGDNKQISNTEQTKLAHGIYLEGTYNLSRHFMCSKWSQVLVNYTIIVSKTDNDHASATLYLNDSFIQQTKSNDGFITSSDIFGTEFKSWSKKTISIGGYGGNKWIIYKNVIFEIKFELKSQHGNDPIALSTISIECRSIPTSNPTQQPSADPTIDPTKEPINDPTFYPTGHPTTAPTYDPTSNPTYNPTKEPTNDPTLNPSNRNPTNTPTSNPTSIPSKHPADIPTLVLTYDTNTKSPTNSPTNSPTATQNNLIVQKQETVSTTYLILISIGIAILICCCIPFCIITYQKWKKDEITINIISIGDKPSNSSTLPSAMSCPNLSTIQMGEKKVFSNTNDRNIITSNEEEGNNINDDVDTDNMNNFIIYKVDLPQYLGIFIKAGYNDLNMIKHIESIEELESIGIDNKQHQYKIMREINLLKSGMPPITPMTPENDNIAIDEFIINNGEDNEDDIIDGQHVTPGHFKSMDSVQLEEIYSDIIKQNDQYKD